MVAGEKYFGERNPLSMEVVQEVQSMGPTVLLQRVTAV